MAVPALGSGVGIGIAKLWAVPMFEEQLVQAVLAGDSEAVNRFCAAVCETVFRHALLVCGSNSDAADVAQVTAMQALHGLPALRKREAGRTWLFRIARRVCTSMEVRARRDLGSRLDDDCATQAPALRDLSPERHAQLEDQIRHLGPALRVLPENQRCILLLHDYEGLTTKETAEVMATTEENVRQQLSRARRSVRARLRRG